MAVGLQGQMGNSEVSPSLNMGAGKYRMQTDQESVQTTKSIQDGDFLFLPDFNTWCPSCLVQAETRGSHTSPQHLG